MSNLPKAVHINEEGPREGFQIEKGAIPTARKIALIDALSQTGLDHIQIVSFVNPKNVPGMADAEDVVRGIAPQPDVAYTALWLNEKGFQRALGFSDRLSQHGNHPARGIGKILASQSEPQRRPAARRPARDRRDVQGRKNPGRARQHHGGIRLQFRRRHPGFAYRRAHAANSRRAAEHGVTLRYITLADTMAWATPLAVKRAIGALRERFPDMDFALHLHDTRGLAIANAYAGLEMGVTRFDAAVAGLGGCPFAGHQGAAGNVCTEDLVFICHEMGIETGIDLDALIECAKLAEDVVGHPLPGSVKTGGTLKKFRL